MSVKNSVTMRGSCIRGARAPQEVDHTSAGAIKHRVLRSLNEPRTSTRLPGVGGSRRTPTAFRFASPAAAENLLHGRPMRPKGRPGSPPTSRTCSPRPCGIGDIPGATNHACPRIGSHRGPAAASAPRARGSGGRIPPAGLPQADQDGERQDRPGQPPDRGLRRQRTLGVDRCRHRVAGRAEDTPVAAAGIAAAPVNARGLAKNHALPLDHTHEGIAERLEQPRGGLHVGEEQRHDPRGRRVPDLGRFTVTYARSPLPSAGTNVPGRFTGLRAKERHPPSWIRPLSRGRRLVMNRLNRGAVGVLASFAVSTAGSGSTCVMRSTPGRAASTRRSGRPDGRNEPVV